MLEGGECGGWRSGRMGGGVGGRVGGLGDGAGRGWGRRFKNTGSVSTRDSSATRRRQEYLSGSTGS